MHGFRCASINSLLALFNFLHLIFVLIMEKVRHCRSHVGYCLSASRSCASRCWCIVDCMGLTCMGCTSLGCTCVGRRTVGCCSMGRRSMGRTSGPSIVDHLGWSGMGRTLGRTSIGSRSRTRTRWVIWLHIARCSPRLICYFLFRTDNMLPPIVVQCMWPHSSATSSRCHQLMFNQHLAPHGKWNWRKRQAIPTRTVCSQTLLLRHHLTLTLFSHHINHKHFSNLTESIF